MVWNKARSELTITTKNHSLAGTSTQIILDPMFTEPTHNKTNCEEEQSTVPITINFEIGCIMEPLTLPVIEEKVYNQGGEDLIFTFDSFMTPADEICELTWNYEIEFTDRTKIPEELITFSSAER